MSRRPSFAQRREALGLTQPQMAEIMGISRAALQLYEAGRRYDGRPLRQRPMFELALEAIEARAAAGKLIVSDPPPMGRPRTIMRAQAARRRRPRSGESFP